MSVEPPGPSAAQALAGWASRHEFCIVGGRGMIGCRVVDQLLAMGARRVVVWGRASSAAVSKGAVYESAEAGGVGSMPWHAGTIVIHLAGNKYAPDGQAEPRAMFDANSSFTTRLLDRARQAGIAGFVLASTAAVYGDNGSAPITEDALPRPASVYAASKAAAEAAVQGFMAQFRFPGVILRLGNVYGPELDERAVWGRVLGQALRREDIRVRCLHPVRDYLHVEEAAEAILRTAAALPLAPPAIVNAGTGRGASVRDWAEAVAAWAEEVLHFRPRIFEDAPDDPASCLVLDVRKLERLTGWAPRLSLREGLRRVGTALLASPGPAAAPTIRP